jgi:hypothetical protein
MHVKSSACGDIKGGTHYVTEKDYCCSNRNCTNNEHYQARLNQVLSKFEHLKDDNAQLEHWSYEVDSTCGLWYINYCPELLFSFEHDTVTFIEGISLDTVELILRDIKEETK